MTTFKNTPQMFKKDMTDTSTTHIGSYYIARKYAKKDTIIVEPLENQILCKTTVHIIVYRDQVKMDALVWKHSMC